MNSLQVSLLLAFSAFSFLTFLTGLYKSQRNHAYGETIPLCWMGIFVWGDAIIFGLFWTITPIIVILIRDWVLFELIFSVFWLVRSVGETIYWLNQQFSTVDRQPPHKLIGYRFFRNDSIWFGWQIFCQTITVVSIIFTLYFAKLWLIK